MVVKGDSVGPNFNEELHGLFSGIDVDYIVKIGGWKSLNSSEVKRFHVDVLDKRSGERRVFNIDNDDGDFDLKMHLRNITIKAIDLKFIRKESRAAFVFDKNLGTEYSFGVVVLEVSRILYRIARFKLSEFMDNELVLEKILKIAQEIKSEGREGKMVGTMFLIGDISELSPYLKPLVLNPFYGYPEEMRDLLSVDLGETIKEYAQLDGAFIVSSKGIVESAGTYVDVNTAGVKKYYGWGTKHLTAAAITTHTKSIVVLVSESGNVIKIFKHGKLILKF